MRRTGSRSKMWPECAACEKRDTCNKKRMCAESYVVPAAAEATQPILRETRTIILNGSPTIVYEDEIKKAMEQSHFKDRFLHFGA